MLLPAVSGGRVSVAGTTADAAAAAPLARRLRPDVVLVDLAMPEPGGLRAITAVRRTEPRARVLAMSGIADVDLVLAALEAGAEGYLSKDSEPELLVSPLLAALEGWSVVPPQILNHLVRARPRRGLVDEVSAAERRLWRFLAEGRPTCEIAQDLHVSERTAKRMVATLLRRLGVTSRTEAATLAGQHGLLSRPER